MTAAGEGYVLLLVEDDATARHFLGRAISLRFANIAVLEAENGRTGLDRYREKHPDIVVTDVNMPVMDGISMAEEIRMLDPLAVIAFVSARCSTPGFVDAAEQVGVYSCVSKPVDLSVFFHAIEECCQKSRAII